MEKNKGYKIIMTGGGSGGHVIPSLALIPQLKKHFSEIIYVGGNGVEMKLAKDVGLKYHEVFVCGLNRKKPLKNLKIPFVLVASVRNLIKYFRAEKPDVIFGKGGYVQMPAVIAARILHIPTVCHESDLSLGLANRIAYKLGATILTGFDKTATLNDDFICTGFPIADKMFFGDKQKTVKSMGLDNTKQTLLVVGGSLGSEAINNVIKDALPTLTKTYNVIHVTGKGKAVAEKQSNYHALEFSDNIQDLYATADVIVSRAGAGAVTEISLLNKAAIFIPLPKSASRGDQLQNAQIAKEHGARVLLQEELTAELLIDSIYKSGRPMSPVAKVGNQKIVSILTTFASSYKSLP